MTRTRWKVDWWNISLLMLAFLASRAIALSLGLRPLTPETVWFMQFLDLDLLHHHLARSLLHLHGQPPLLNALVGISEKLAGSHYGDLIASFYACLGLSAAIAVYLSLTLVRVSPTLSLLVSLVLLLNPSEILSEFDPIYTIPVATIHCFMALATICYLQTRSVRSLASIVGLAVLLTLLRSPYQWMWVVVLMAIFWWQVPERRAQLRTAGVIGLFLSLLWPAKNEILFHHFASTTWAPFSLAKHWDWNGAAVQKMVAQNNLTTFAPPDNSDEAVSALLQSKWQSAPTGYPELDDVTKKTGGAVNWNSIAGLRLNDARKVDIKYLLRHNPTEFATNVLHSVAIYFYPSSQYFSMFGESSGRYELLTQHYRPLRTIDMKVRRICCNIFGLPPDTSAIPFTELSHMQEPHSFASILKKTCVGALLLSGIVLLCVLSFLWPSFWKGAQERKATVMILSFTIVYSFLVNLVEFGENERYRFETQALFFLVAVLFVQQMWDRRLQNESLLQAEHPLTAGA